MAAEGVEDLENVQGVLPESVYTKHVIEESRLQLKRVLKEIDPDGKAKLEPEVEIALLHLIDDFVVQLTKSAVLCASHRDSKTLEVEDLRLSLEMDHGISIPGFRPRKKRKNN